MLPKIDGYDVERLVSSGVGVDAYQGVQRSTGRSVFLKRAREDGLEARVLRHEAKVLAVLSHPGIVFLVDFVDGPTPTLVTEFAEGQTLKEWSAQNATRHRRLGAGREPGREVARNILRALSHIHERGLVHGDLTPENVIVNAAGDVKIVDFGATRSIANAETMSSSMHPEPHAVTPAFASPEQVLGERLDARSDLYSLGRVLSLLRVGHPSFLKRMCAKSPADRYATALLAEEAMDASAPAIDPRHMYFALIGAAFLCGAFIAEGGWPSRAATNRSASSLVDSFGYLAVLARPWANVLVDGEQMETTPFARPIPLPAGTHHVRLVHPEFPPFERHVTIPPHEVVTLEATLTAAPP